MNESNIFGISIRAYIVFIMVTAFVVMSFMKMEVDSTFSTLVVSLISYYFGQKTSSTSEVKNEKHISAPVSPTP
jgi:hypothetical protein